jgi:uncharacterized protein
MGKLEEDSEKSTVIPFDTYVVKVVSRCNLNCSYCYMYNLADKTYRNQPGIMSLNTCAAMTRRIYEHAKAHGVTKVHIILHGGEPLLMGKENLSKWVNKIKDILYPDIHINFSMQSNGVLIDEEWIDLLSYLGVSIGISLDGPKELNDKFRVYHDGTGSFDDVVRSIRLIQSHPNGKNIFGGVMAVLDPDIDPLEVWKLWQFLGVHSFDISIPHCNHLHLPRQGSYSVGEWLIRLFDLWFDQNDPKLRMRYFENIIRMIFGYPYSTDYIGGKPIGVIVVETDGGIEPTDAFKCCEEGITKLSLNVYQNSFDDVYKVPMVKVLQHGRPNLCDMCQKCEVVDVCGGGYMPHRYRPDTQFDNPSIYCVDLYRLIKHIRKRIDPFIPESVLAPKSIEKTN